MIFINLYNDCYESMVNLYEYFYTDIWYCCCYKTHYYMEELKVDNVYTLYKSENGYNESLLNHT